MGRTIALIVLLQGVGLLVGGLLLERFWIPYADQRQLYRGIEKFRDAMPTLREVAQSDDSQALRASLSDLQQSHNLIIEEISDGQLSMFTGSQSSLPVGQLWVDDFGTTAIIRLTPSYTISVDSYYTERSTDVLLGWVIAWMITSAISVWVLMRMGRRIAQVSSGLDEFLQQRLLRLPKASGSSLVDELQTRCVEVAENSVRQREATQASIADQRDLLHAVAHEFRSPISRIRFAHDILVESEHQPANTELLNNVDIAVTELDGLVTEVLGYSRIKDGGYKLNLEPLSIRDVIMEVERRIRAVYPNVAIDVVADPSAPAVCADRVLLIRALVNLARNAARFANNRVRIESAQYEDHFTLSVDDDGIGIPPGKRERIFEPFTRLDASRSRDSGGVGLGLAIVNAISVQHEGSVKVIDSLLGGARFELTWPVR